MTKTRRQRVETYGAKLDLLFQYIAGTNVVHLGAIGETCETTDVKLREAPQSVHAYISRVSAECVGVDIDEPTVLLLKERGIFDNVIALDATQLRRPDIPLDRIDFVLAPDLIEHLSNPGDLLESIKRIASPDNAKLIITTSNSFGIPNAIRYFRGWAVEGRDHVCTFNVFTLTNLLQRHGWKPRVFHTCYQAQAQRVNNPVAFLLGRWILRRLPQGGGTLFCVAEIS